VAISSTTSSVSYTGNNSTTTAYPITYRHDAPAWLLVQQEDADGARTTLALGSDYTLAGDGAATTGTLKTVVAVPLSDTLHISRVTPATQSLSLLPSSPIPSADLEAVLDKMAMGQQDQALQLTRTLQARRGEAPGAIPTTAERASKGLAFDASGDPTTDEVFSAAEKADLAALDPSALAASVAAASDSETAAAASETAAAASETAAAASETAAAASETAAAASETAAAASAISSKGTATAANEAARIALVPLYTGQPLTQLDNLSDWVAYGILAGNWQPSTPLRDIIRAPHKLSANREDNPEKRPNILFLGDSMIGTTRYQLVDDSHPDRFGEIADYGLMGPVLFGGTASTDYTYWPCEVFAGTGQTHRLLSSGSGDVKSNIDTTRDIACDEITVYYAKENGAGAFKMQAGPVAGPFVDYGPSGAGTVNVDADNGGAIALGIARIKVPRGSYTLNLEHVSGGTIHILSSRFRKTWSNGIGAHLIFEGSSGIKGSPSGYIRTSNVLMQGVLDDLDLDLVWCHFYDGHSDDAGYRSLYTAWNGFAGTHSAAPHWLFLSRLPYGTNNAAVLAAQRDHAAYLWSLASELNESFIDVAPAFGRQPMADGLTEDPIGPHATTEGSLVLVDYVFTRLPYLAPTAGRTSGPVAANSILHVGDMYDILRRTLREHTPFQFPNITGSSHANVTRTFNKITAGVGSADGSTGYVILGEDILSGINTGAGTYFYASSVCFYVRVQGRVSHADSKFRIFLGASATGTDLTGKGFGLEFTSTGTNIISHDGTTRSASTEALAEVKYNDYSGRTYICWLDTGVIYASEMQTLSADFPAIIKHSSNAPSAAAASGFDNLMLSFQQSGSVVATNSSQMQVVNAGLVSSTGLYKP